MTKNYFLNQAKSFTSEPENEGTFLGSKEKKNAGKEQGQDWSKICSKEVENE